MSDFVQKPLETKLLCLLKVGSKEHIESLANGKIFCRHLKFYKDPSHKDKSFYDPHEGLAGIFQPELSCLEIGIENEKNTITQGSGLISPVLISKNLNIPAFCLHAIHTGDWTNRKFNEDEIEVFKTYLQIPDEMTKFENYVMVITNAEEFFVRLKTACNKESIRILGRGLVKYADLAKVHGKIPEEFIGFIKQSKHSPEREYRFTFGGNKELPDPFDQLNIGSLKDITLVMPLKEFMSDWSIQFE